MNERIDLLALNATDNKGGLDRHKFAALVEAAARADEREECAKVCEPQEEHDDPLTAWKIAKAIRARGTT